VEAGNFTDSEILVMLGENGTGKTTFIRMLAGMLPADDAEEELQQFNVSYKPQKISPKFEGTVSSLLRTLGGGGLVVPEPLCGAGAAVWCRSRCVYGCGGDAAAQALLHASQAHGSMPRPGSHWRLAAGSLAG
jgi:energy-coupling factor transporter ATP-binding protein EcfA2